MCWSYRQCTWHCSFFFHSWEACASMVRQCLNHLSHKPPGGNQVCTVVAGVPGPPVVGGSLPSQHEGDVFARGTVQGCRLPIPLQASTGGVAVQPKVVLNICDVFGRGGSNCHRGVDPLPPLVLLDRGGQPSGPGCSRPQLARGSSL